MPLRTQAPVASSAAMNVAASGLRAQQARMRVIAENIANSDSTAVVAGGDPYRRQSPVFEPKPVPGGQGVGMTDVIPDETPFKMEYNPGHPAANAEGYVKTSNVNPLTEALDMRQAQRAYEANLNVIEAARSMQTRTLDILKR